MVERKCGEGGRREWKVFFLNDTATTKICTLSLRDALPSYPFDAATTAGNDLLRLCRRWPHARSEEHTSELQSRQYLVCRLLLEKTKSNSSPTSPGTRYAYVLILFISGIP